MMVIDRQVRLNGDYLPYLRDLFTIYNKNIFKFNRLVSISLFYIKQGSAAVKHYGLFRSEN